MDSLLNGTVIVILTQLIVGGFKVGSFTFSIFLSSLYLASAVGSSTLDRVHSHNRIIVATSFITIPLSIAAYLYAPNFFWIFIVSFIVYFFRAMGQTVLYQVIYEDHTRKEIAIVNQIILFLLTAPYVVGSFLGGVVSENYSVDNNFLLLSLVTALNAVFSILLISRLILNHPRNRDSSLENAM